MDRSLSFNAAAETSSAIPPPFRLLRSASTKAYGFVKKIPRSASSFSINMNTAGMPKLRISSAPEPQPRGYQKTPYPAKTRHAPPESILGGALHDSPLVAIGAQQRVKSWQGQRIEPVHIVSRKSLPPSLSNSRVSFEVARHMSEPSCLEPLAPFNLGSIPITVSPIGISGDVFGNLEQPTPLVTRDPFAKRDQAPKKKTLQPGLGLGLPPLEIDTNALEMRKVNVKKSQHKRNSAQPAELVQALLPHRMPNFMKVFITTHRPHQLAPVKLNDPVEVPAIPIHFAASLPEAVLRGTRKTHYRPKHLADRRSGGRRTTSQVRPKSRGETGTHTIIVNQWDLDSVLQPKRFSLPNTAKPAEETMSVPRRDRVRLQVHLDNSHVQAKENTYQDFPRRSSLPQEKAPAKLKATRSPLGEVKLPASVRISMGGFGWTGRPQGLHSMLGFDMIGA